MGGYVEFVFYGLYRAIKEENKVFLETSVIIDF
jgi:hypothetical protein